MKKLFKELKYVYQVTNLSAVTEYIVLLLFNFPAVIKTRTLTVIDEKWAKNKTVYKFHCDGQTFILPAKYISGIREMYGRKVYFKEPRFKAQKGNTCIDLGANVGLFSLKAAKDGADLVVSVEAQKAFVDCIKKGYADNEIRSRYVIYNNLIGSKTGVFSDVKKLTDSPDSEGFVPPIVSLNEIFDDNSIMSCDFMKIDIEGSEFELLSEGLEWLAKTKKIVMEVHTEFGDETMLIDVLSKNGFVCRCYTTDLDCVNNLDHSEGYLYAYKE